MKKLEICQAAANASTIYEQCNTELKKMYMLKHILLFNAITKNTKGFMGSFGTGYPFYALNNNLEGTLPVIEEQLRYNQELITFIKDSDKVIWPCESCLLNSNKEDIKESCSKCTKIENCLKPRKIINRLPDMDLWMICQEENISTAKKELIDEFKKNNIESSDINPIKTINDVCNISKKISINEMPNKKLPLDAHIIGYNNIYNLISKIPNEIDKSYKNNVLPYLPIHPDSYRIGWIKDDVPYNFIHDFLYSLTDYNFDERLTDILREVRQYLIRNYSIDTLKDIAVQTGNDSVYRRTKTKQLNKLLVERLNLWKN